MAPTSKPSSKSISKSDTSSSNKKRPISVPPQATNAKKATTSKAVKGRKNPTDKVSVTKSLATHGFSVSRRDRFQPGHKLLLDDTIYDDKVPPEVKGKLFLYQITSIDPNLKSATIQYKNQVTNVGGDRFTTYEEGEDPQVSLFCCCLFLFVSNCILLPKLFSFLQVHDDPL